MAKLSREQLKEARRQAKEVREKAMLELEAADPTAAEEKKANKSVKKDKRGFSQEERSAIRELKGNLPTEQPKLTWNYSEGDLVYLPDSSIGIIAKNNAVDVVVGYVSHDMKQTMKQNKYTGKVYVVTSAGNNWYYPRQLKKVKE